MGTAHPIQYRLDKSPKSLIGIEILCEMSNLRKIFTTTSLPKGQEQEGDMGLCTVHCSCPLGRDVVVNLQHINMLRRVLISQFILTQFQFILHLVLPWQVKRAWLQMCAIV